MVKRFLIFGLILFFPFVVRAGVILKTPTSLGLASGLVGYWTFDGADTYWSSDTAGNVVDKSGQNNTGVLTNMSRNISPASGKIGQSLVFDGSNDEVDLSSRFINPGTVFTISMWIYPLSGSSGNTSLLVAQSDIGLFYNGTSKKVNYSYLGDRFNNTQLVENSWNHIVLVNDSGNYTFYINGVADGSGSGGFGFWMYHISLSTNSFKGRIDDVRIYNRTISANEASRLYNIGVSSKVKIQKTSTSSDLLGHWTFDGGDIYGTTVYDKSSAGNNGVITGATKALGVFGQSLNFTNSSQILTVTGNSPNATQYSVSAWINTPTAVSTVGKTIYGEIWTGDCGYSLFKLIVQDNDTFVAGTTVSLFVEGSSLVSSPSIVLKDNTWVHIVGVFDSISDTHNIYVNGVKYSSNVAKSAIRNDLSVNTYVGGNTGPCAANFDGKIDDVRVFNKALGESDVLQLYNMSNANKIKTPTSSVSSGLVGHWTFDGADTYWSSATAGTVSDKSGNNNTGTMYDMFRSSSPVIGKLGQALSFIPTTNRISLVATDSLKLTTSGSISVWAYQSEANNAIEYSIFSYPRAPNSGTTAYRLYKYDDDERLSFYIQDSQLVFFSVGSSVNKWRHYVVTWDNTNIRGYADGELVNTYAQTATPSYSTPDPPKIGNFEIANSSPWRGRLDELRIYNRAVSPSEVKLLYSMGR